MIKCVLVQKENIHKHTYYNLDEFSILYRSNVKEFIDVVFKEVLQNLEEIKVTRETVNKYKYEKIENTYMATYQFDNTIILAICSDKLKDATLRIFFNKIMKCNSIDEEVEYIKYFIKNYDKEIDKIDKITQQLDETKEIMMRNIDLVIKRGQSLDDLLQKSADLSASSKIFLNRTKKLNKCCVIL
ncbi:MAG: hypothetical protein Edafosvirus3_10 [Edafosvirus sp.]|uniref:V-SNARE coiled-coil homology domain-containing protein n=1 Tax=Edafosvirus sp. TaxID=2487765 RepID=A0A3G4ZSP5_9VIRU|nr:MAG: hypothetical protein Edafosvirus3_10 [Edafosvirus sp.]